MFRSFRYSQIVLRIILAVIFLWWGIDKFIHPDYWLNTWLPKSISLFFSEFGIQAIALIYFCAIFEIITAGSLLLDIFLNSFALLAAVYIAIIFVFHGFNIATIKDAGLISAFLALAFWPNRRI